MLLLDRFLVAAGTALDLATGHAIRIRWRRTASRHQCLAQAGRWYLVDTGCQKSGAFIEAWGRRADAPSAEGVCVDPVREALADARDGRPRAIDLVVGDGARWRRAVHDVAREATSAGFVPVAVDVLGEVLRSARWRWPRWLAQRSMVVLAGDAPLTAASALALLRLATRDARPHLLVRGATHGLDRPLRWGRQPALVHDAPAHAGWPPAPEPTTNDLADQAWRRAEGGQADEKTAALARWAIELAPSPGAEAMARAALSRTLTAQGRTLEARAILGSNPLAPGPGALPTGVHACVDRAERDLRDAEVPATRDQAWSNDFLRVLELCQQAEDEGATLGAVLALLRDRLAAATLAVVCEESAQVRLVAHVGTARGPWRVAPLVLQGGHAMPPQPGEAIAEGGWPVRYAGQVTGALCCRWSGPLPVAPAAADALLRLAALAVAPLLQALVDRGRALAEAPDVPDLVGESEVMRALRAAALRAARSPFPVLIEGESGAGKEVVARVIHRASPRRDRRLSTLNCAALTEELAEAELFGHARGAFTGAVAERAGLFEEATGGTLFLDEVSELSLRIQAKLLRVLQEHEVRRLGEAHVRRVDVRIVAASNRPLAAEVDGGRFRRDLRYRLDVIRLQVPALRERLDDLPALVRHLWDGLRARTGSRAVLAPSALAALGRYDWPGNVRELQNVLASVIVSAAPRGAIPASQLPAHIGRAASLGPPRSLAEARRAFESRYVRAALARAGGRPGSAARELGLSRQGLAKLVARLGLTGGHDVGAGG